MSSSDFPQRGLLFMKITGILNFSWVFNVLIILPCSFNRLLVHGLCQFLGLTSTSKCIKLTCLLFKLFSVNLRPNTNRYWVIFFIEHKRFCVMVEYHSLPQVNFFHGKRLAKNPPTRCGFGTSSMSYLVSHHVTSGDMDQKA